MKTYNSTKNDNRDAEADHWETAAEWEALMRQYER